MRTQITDSNVKLWLSARDTADWANRPDDSWPCSELSGHRLFVEFDRNGIVDLAIDGRLKDCDGTELTACTSDHLRDKLPKEHKLYFITVGQFNN